MYNLREHADWKWLLTFCGAFVIGGILGAITVASQMAADASVWRSPWWYVSWALVAIGVAPVVWKGWPEIRRIRFRWPFRLPFVLPNRPQTRQAPAMSPPLPVEFGPQQRDATEERISSHPKPLSAIGKLMTPSRDPADLQGQIRRLEDDVDSLRLALDGAHATAREHKDQLIAKHEELSDCRSALERAERARLQAEAHMTIWFNRARYDIEPRDLSPLDKMELVVAHNDMKKLRGVMAAAGQGIFDLAKQLGSPMESRPDEKNKIIARYFGERRFQPTKHLYDRLFEELVFTEHETGERVDYREWLIHFYEAYNELRRTITQMALFTGIKLPELPEYRAWRAQDRVFLEKVGDIGVMHDVIKAVNERHNYPLPMPD